MLGCGYSGTVYRAGDTMLDKTVALKVLEVGADASRVLRFQNEARVVARLDHPNIVRVLDFNLDEQNKLYIVFELIEGQSLTSMIEDRGVIPVSEWMALGEDILKGLEHAHAHGVTHRDLNPNNILIDFGIKDSPHAKIVDFGIACLKDVDFRLTRQGVGIGTPEYMSPEQCRGQAATAAADIYSFGCVCFAALTGRPPHTGDTVLDTIMAHVNLPAPRLNEVRPDLLFPRQLEELVAKALKQDPNERYQSTSQLLTEFRAIAESFNCESGDSAEDPRSVTLHAVKGTKTISWFLVFLLTGVVAVTFGTIAYNRLSASSYSDYNLERILEHGNLLYSPFEGDVARQRSTVNSSQRDRLSARKLVLQSNGGQPDFIHVDEFRINEPDEALPKIGGLGLDVHPNDMTIANECLRPLLENPDPGVYYLRCFNDEDLKIVRNLRGKIRQLFVAGTYNIRGPGLRHLAGLPLESLELKKGLFDDSGLEYLPPLPLLQSFGVPEDKKIRGTTISAQKFPSLQYLNLQGTGVTDAGLKGICKLKHLHMLVLNDTAVTGAAMGDIAKIPELQLLSLARCPIEPRYLPKLCAAPALSNLNLDALKLENYDFLYKVKHLQTLSINDSSINDRQFAELLRQCRNLRSLAIKRCSNLTISGLEALADSKVEDLCLSSDGRINDEVVEVLIRCKKLESLSAEKTKLTFPAVNKLLAKSSIKTINISDPIKEVEVKQLRVLFPRKKIEYVEF